MEIGTIYTGMYISRLVAENNFPKLLKKGEIFSS